MIRKRTVITTYKSSYKQTAKNYVRAVQGYKNKKQGADFEEDISKSCEVYENYKIAFIEKTPEPFKITRSLGNGQFQGHYEKSAQPDFKGTIRGGRAICFDAKCTSTEKISLSMLTDEELRCLKLHKELGAWAGVLMCFIHGNTRTYAIMQIDDFMSAKALNGHKHWTVDEVSKWKVRVITNPNGYFIDFLSKILSE